MSDIQKPPIYGFCPAGCKWETMHKEDIEAGLTYVELPIDENNQCYLETGKQYKIISEISSNAYVCSIKFVYLNGTTTSYTFSTPHNDRYSNSIVFKLLEVLLSVVGIKLVFEINGVRYEEVISGTTSAELLDSNYLYVEDAEKVFKFNDEARVCIAANEVFVRYSSSADGSGFTSNWSDGQNYIGVMAGHSGASANKEDYTWSLFKGAKGDRGDSGLSTGAVLSNAPGTSDINGYTQQAVNNIVSNPNLLINGDFRVNQRGQSSYLLSNGDNKYTVDRWKLNRIETINIQENGITINNMFSYGYLVQPIEDYQKFKGKTITLSVKVNSINYSTGSIFAIIRDGVSNNKVFIPSGSNGIFSVTKTISENATLLDIRCIYNESNTTSDVVASIEWAKLEIGTIATTFNPRPFAEELAMCQRYYQRYNFTTNMPLPIGVGINTTTISINTPIPKMRTLPSFTTSGTVKMLIENITGLSLVYNQYYDGMLRYFINTTGIVQSQAYLLVGDTAGYYELDAEIY